MTHSLDDALVERLRHRAVARLSLKRPTKTDRYDAELDNSAADRIAALEAAGVAELREETERLRGAASALVAKLDECQPVVANLFAMQFVRSGVGYTGPSYGEELETLRTALTNQGKAQG